MVPTDYDPLLGKLIAWGNDRTEAIARLRRALEEYAIGGIQTNLSLFRRLLANPEYQRAEIYTRWLDEWLARSPAASESHVLPEPEETAAVLAAALFHIFANGLATGTNKSGAVESPKESPWKQEGRRAGLARDPRASHA